MCFCGLESDYERTMGIGFLSGELFQCPIRNGRAVAMAGTERLSKGLRPRAQLAVPAGQIGENHTMSIDDFGRYSRVLHGLTADFVRAVPEDKWDFTPDPPGTSGRAPSRDMHEDACLCANTASTKSWCRIPATPAP